MGSRAEVTTLLLLLLLLVTLKSNTGRKVGRKAGLRGNFEELLLLFRNQRRAFLRDQILLSMFLHVLLQNHQEVWRQRHAQDQQLGLRCFLYHPKKSKDFHWIDYWILGSPSTLTDDAFLILEHEFWFSTLHNTCSSFTICPHLNSTAFWLILPLFKFIRKKTEPTSSLLSELKCGRVQKSGEFWSFWSKLQSLSF